MFKDEIKSVLSIIKLEITHILKLQSLTLITAMYFQIYLLSQFPDIAQKFFFIEPYVYRVNPNHIKEIHHYIQNLIRASPYQACYPPR